MSGGVYSRGLLVAGVVAVLMTGAVIAMQRTPGPSGDETSSAEDIAAIEAAATPKPRQPSNVWMGDEVLEGCCRAERSSPTMARTVADALGWRRPIEVGAAGVGYVSGGRAGVPLFARLDRHLTTRAAQVVVLGGAVSDYVNARRFDEAAFRAAVRATFDKVLTLAPGVTLIVLGPYSNRPDVYPRLRGVLAQEAARVNAPFIDIIGHEWMVGHPELMSRDGFHPNDAGHVYLGTKIAEVLRPILPPALVTT